MAIPRYNEMYRNFLECLKDGQPHKSKEVREAVAAAMSVTEEEQKRLLPSGKQAMYDNRFGWTRTYLKKAGLLESPSRGVFVITTEGSNLLAENPAVINDDLLMRYEKFSLI
ncbi:Mrr restriction system protein [Sporotomaculum syntrophicum]|uniref:Mrr restriction system protein n=1 Tax=Sporotomaculum syntrophicum TaxID=182264 RepID=A0A9D2WP47_9FIRM|nr:winged helix-turn-helix domain-containing protein [Sporotomaculum syntrophicum]KAF1084331.1 Mrr restriction system protein [Sporotomaculum syntrophicum]